MYNSCNKSNSYNDEKSISVTDSSVVDCLNDFDYLVEIIKTDYPSYNDKVKDENRLQLMDLEKVIRQKIAIHPDSCMEYLKEYTNFLNLNIPILTNTEVLLSWRLV